MKRPKVPKEIDNLHNACGLVAMCALGLWADGDGWHQKTGITLGRMVRNVQRQAVIQEVTFSGKHPNVKQFAKLPLYGRFLVHTKNHVGVLWSGKVYDLPAKATVLRAWHISKKRKKK
jgi:hypothetical protein